MSDTIELRGLRGFGRHGVLASERATGQDFVVDVTLVVDTRDAAESDDLKATVDYGSVGLAVVAEIEAEPVDLLETLAARIADRCLHYPLVEVVTVSVHKPQAPLAVPFSDVIVTITRSR